MDTSTLIAGSEDDEPLTALRALAELERKIAREEAVQVRRARNAGHPWAAIAASLGVSRQAVHRRYANSRRDRKES